VSVRFLAGDLIANSQQYRLARVVDLLMSRGGSDPREARHEIHRVVDAELRAMVDADVLPSGTTIVAGDGPEQSVAQVLPDGRLYADGETYDGLIELSETLELDGSPWSLWSAELEDGRVALGVLREDEAA
jgi:hypothetical protein